MILNSPEQVRSKMLIIADEIIDLNEKKERLGSLTSVDANANVVTDFIEAEIKICLDEFTALNKQLQKFIEKEQAENTMN